MDFMNMSPINTSRRQLSARTLAITESEYPASATTRYLVHNADQGSPLNRSCAGQRPAARVGVAGPTPGLTCGFCSVGRRFTPVKWRAQTCRLFTIGDAPRDRLSGAQSYLFCGTLNNLLETLPCSPSSTKYSPSHTAALLREPPVVSGAARRGGRHAVCGRVVGQIWSAAGRSLALRSCCV